MKSNGRRRRLGWFWPVLAAIVLYFLSVLVSQQMHLNQVGQSQAIAENRLSAAQQENARLKQEISDLHDLAHIERIAREELGMTKQGELPYSAARK